MTTTAPILLNESGSQRCSAPLAAGRSARMPPPVTRSECCAVVAPLVRRVPATTVQKTNTRTEVASCCDSCRPGTRCSDAPAGVESGPTGVGPGRPMDSLPAPTARPRPDPPRASSNHRMPAIVIPRVNVKWPHFPSLAPCDVEQPVFDVGGAAGAMDLLSADGLSLDFAHVNQPTPPGVNESRDLDRPVPVFATPLVARAQLGERGITFSVPCNARTLQRAAHRDDNRLDTVQAPVAEYFAVRISDLVAAAFVKAGVGLDANGVPLINRRVNPGLGDVSGFRAEANTPADDRFAFEHEFNPRQVLEVGLVVSVGPGVAPVDPQHPRIVGPAVGPAAAQGGGPGRFEQQPVPPAVDGVFVGLGRIRGTTPILQGMGLSGSPAYGRAFIVGSSDNTSRLVPRLPVEAGFGPLVQTQPLRRGGRPSLMAAGGLDTYRPQDAAMHSGFAMAAVPEPNGLVRSVLSDFVPPRPLYQLRQFRGQDLILDQSSNDVNTASWRHLARAVPPLVEPPDCSRFSFRVTISQLDAYIGGAGRLAGVNPDLDPDIKDLVQAGPQLFYFPDDDAQVDPVANRRALDLADCRGASPMNFALVKLKYLHARGPNRFGSRYFQDPLHVRPVGAAALPDQGAAARVFPGGLIGQNEYIPLCGPLRERALIFGAFASDRVRCDSDWLRVNVSEFWVRFSNKEVRQAAGGYHDGLDWYVNEFVDQL